MATIHRPISGWRPSTPEIVADGFASLAASHPTIAIHFWAEWNGVDPAMDQSVQEIAHRFADRVHFVSCNVDRPENQQLCKRVRVATVPTIAVFKKDELKGIVLGLREPEQLAAEIEKLLTTQQTRASNLWRRLVSF
jgi:thiol-disulfide isomerase/thioredoxin